MHWIKEFTGKDFQLSSKDAEFALEAARPFALLASPLGWYAFTTGILFNARFDHKNKQPFLLLVLHAAVNCNCGLGWGLVWALPHMIVASRWGWLGERCVSPQKKVGLGGIWRMEAC